MLDASGLTVTSLRARLSLFCPTVSIFAAPTELPAALRAAAPVRSLMVSSSMNSAAAKSGKLRRTSTMSKINTILIQNAQIKI